MKNVLIKLFAATIISICIYGCNGCKFGQQQTHNSGFNQSTSQQNYFNNEQYIWETWYFGTNTTDIITN